MPVAAPVRSDKRVHDGSVRVAVPPSPPPIRGPGRRPLAVATIAAGSGFRKILAVTRPSQERYAERVGADYVVETKTVSEEYPGFADKFRLVTLLDQYERVLYLDADVVVRPSCPDLFRLVEADKVGLHDDFHCLTRWAWLANEYEALSLAQGWDVLPPTFCYNTGVVVFSRGHEAMFAPPPQPFAATWCGEQNVIGHNVKRAGLPVHQLDWKLNWQWYADPNEVWAAGAHVIHAAGMENMGAGRRARLELLKRWAAVAATEREPEVGDDVE